MPRLQRRPFGDADNVRAVPNGRLETYDLGDLRVGRSILEPGWRWSESVKPIARTEWCEFHHIGLCVAGVCRITMRGGAELVIGAGQFYEVPPGHDAEVIGDEPYVTIDWNPSTGFAQSEGGFVATFDGAERAIRAAQEIGRALSELGLTVRAAVHTGELELEGGDVRGLNVHIAARILALCRPGEVYASWATRELLAGSSIGFIDRGLHELKGLADQRRVYLVEPPA